MLATVFSADPPRVSRVMTWRVGRLIGSRGGPRHGPPHPPALGAPRETRGAPRSRACSSAHVGGPDMAPHTPQRSERPGKPVALLGHARAHRLTWGAPTWPPPPPRPPGAPGNPRRPPAPPRPLRPRRGGPPRAPPPPPPAARPPAHT